MMFVNVMFLSCVWESVDRIRMSDDVKKSVERRRENRRVATFAAVPSLNQVLWAVECAFLTTSLSE